MDLAKYDTGGTEGRFLHLEFPPGEKLKTEEGEAVGITLISSDTVAYQEAQHAAAVDRMNDMVFEKQGQNSVRVKSAGNLSRGKDALELLCIATREFHNIIVEGETWSSIRSEELYTRFVWIREQVDAFVHDRLNHVGEQ